MTEDEGTSPRAIGEPDKGHAARLRGFGATGSLSIVLILVTGNLLGAALVFVWAAASGTSLSELGFVRPRSWVTDAIRGIIGGVALKVFLKSVVMPMLGLGAINQTYHYVAGNAAVLPGLLLFVIVGGGLGEETIWRGFMFQRVKSLLDGSAWETIATVAITTVLFASAHLLEQGWPGAIQAVFTGAVFGTTYARVRRIWPVVIAHAAFDIAAVLMIYWNLEEPTAHLFFR